MQKATTLVSITFLSLLSGCAHLDFGDKGLTYYDPTPYLFVTTTADCVTTATLVVVPGSKNAVKFVSGYGTADLSLSLSNGMVTNAGQVTDTKIPETITAISGLTTAAVSAMKAPPPSKEAVKPPPTCKPTAKLYPIVAGAVEEKPLSFEIEQIYGSN